MAYKNILITGATSGIGRCTAMYLSQLGYHCVILGRNKEKLDLLKKEMDHAFAITYDLNDLYHVNNVFDEIKKEKIKLDGMVHCAGISPLMKVEENDIDVMLETFRINYFSFVELAKGFLNKENSNDGSGVVVMSSVASKCASYRQTVYGSSKAAVNEAVRCMAKEGMHRRIRFNAILAGAVETEMLCDLEEKSEGLKEKLQKIYPLGVIRPTRISEMIEFLLSNKSEYVTGSCIEMDAGFSAWK